MLIYDRGLFFGSCLGEGLGYPLAALAIAALLATIVAVLVRRFGTAGVRVLPWVILGTGTVVACIMAVALAGSILARLEVSGSGRELVFGFCRGLSPAEERYGAAEVAGRFFLREKAKGPPDPTLELRRGAGSIATIWMGHPGLDLDALARIAPAAVSDYRRWRARSSMLPRRADRFAATTMVDR